MMTETQNVKLLNAVTEYDRKQSTGKYYNMYALSHYLGACHAAEERIAAGMSVRQALAASFTGRLLDVVLKAVGEVKSTDAEQRF